MCGIMGYNGEKNATDIVICGLTELEYRGYDSAGLSVFGKTGITTVKTTGRVFSLREKCDKIEGFCGIGHTRWATHGEVSVKNAHPHTTKNIALVHNGIIENYSELKDFLIDKGYTFNTDTDTEIALMLIDYYYENGNSPIEAITYAIKSLRGSYAFAIIFTNDKNTIYAVKKDSPLLIGIGQGEMFLASDLSAFNEYTDKYIRLADYEIAKIGKINLELFNLESKPLPIKINKRDGEADLSDMEGFSHFMEKEIFQQPDILSRELLYYTENLMPKFDFPDLEPISYIRLIACGTAYHAALIGAQFIEKTAKIPSRAETAGEFIYSQPLLNPNELCILISQSGETADTLSAQRLIKNKGLKALAIVNAKNSTIATNADFVLYNHAGREIAVASTKAFSSQIIILRLLSIYFAIERNVISKKEAANLISNIQSAVKGLSKSLEKDLNLLKAADIISAQRNVFFIGRGEDYILALEGALKMKEITYINCQALPAGELKHGTISLIEKGTVVIAFCSNSTPSDKAVNSIKEVQARGAFVISICPEVLENVISTSDITITFSAKDYDESLFHQAIILQLLAYETAKLLGRDIDKPRNLAKSVTVE